MIISGIIAVNFLLNFDVFQRKFEFIERVNNPEERTFKLSYLNVVDIFKSQIVGQRAKITNELKSFTDVVDEVDNFSMFFDEKMNQMNILKIRKQANKFQISLFGKELTESKVKQCWKITIDGNIKIVVNSNNKKNLALYYSKDNVGRLRYFNDISCTNHQIEYSSTLVNQINDDYFDEYSFDDFKVDSTITSMAIDNNKIIYDSLDNTKEYAWYIKEGSKWIKKHSNESKDTIGNLVYTTSFKFIENYKKFIQNYVIYNENKFKLISAINIYDEDNQKYFKENIIERILLDNIDQTTDNFKQKMKSFLSNQIYSNNKANILFELKENELYSLDYSSKKDDYLLLYKINTGKKVRQITSDLKNQNILIVINF